MHAPQNTQRRPAGMPEFFFMMSQAGVQPNAVQPFKQKPKVKNTIGKIAKTTLDDEERKQKIQEEQWKREEQNGGDTQP